MTIKQLKKRIKKLDARIDDMSKKISALQDAAGISVTEQVTAELPEESEQEEASQDSIFSEDDVEKAEEMTEDAEEIADIREKKEKKKKKKKAGR